MPRKKTNIYDIEKQRYWERYNQAISIRDKFPTLKSLDICMDYENPDWGGNPKADQHKYSQESKAFFEIKCPHRECVSGGFNLFSEVCSLIESGHEKATGTITCQGWQDIQRINQHHCFLELNYKIVASYIDNA